MNETALSSSLSAMELFVYTKTVDFVVVVLILCPASLPNSYKFQ